MKVYRGEVTKPCCPEETGSTVKSTGTFTRENWSASFTRPRMCGMFTWKRLRGMTSGGASTLGPSKALEPAAGP